jgi:hypothetical protein
MQEVDSEQRSLYKAPVLRNIDCRVQRHPMCYWESCVYATEGPVLHSLAQSASDFAEQQKRTLTRDLAGPEKGLARTETRQALRSLRMLTDKNSLKVSIT